MTVSFEKVEAIIWDLDNTLYRLDEAIIHAFNIAVARAALEAGVELPMDEAIRMAKQSFKDHGYSGYVFIQEYGVESETLHYKVHGLADEKVIEKSHETRDLFSTMDMQHILLTHSAKDWALRVLEHTDLLEFFPVNHILAFEDYNFQPKNNSLVPFEMSLDLLGLKADKVLMVEDTVQNLKIPHDMGMFTALIHHGQEPEDVSDYVHMACSNAVEVLQKIKTDK